MKGKLYVRSYYDGIMDGVYNINIARGNMNGIEDKRISLAPSKELFNWFKENKNKDNWFDDYRKVYLNQLKNNSEALKDLSEIKLLLEEGKNVCIYCFCRKVELCHRSIIANMFIKKDFEVIIL